MARITPSSGSTIDLTTLEDDEPIHGILKKPKDGWFTQGSAEYGGEDRLTIDWELEDGETIRDWVSLRLGKSTKTGQVSKLRMLLNALGEKPRDSWVWFNNETLEWGYDEQDIAMKNPYAKVTEGLEVIFRGVHGTKQDGSGKFTIQKYAPVKSKASEKKPAGKGHTARDVDPDEVPF